MTFNQQLLAVFSR